MTRRQRLEAVIRGEITEELVESCKEELKKLNAEGAKALAKSKETSRYKENKELEGRIIEVLGEEPIQVEELKEKLGVDLTRQRLTSLCTNLVREGLIESVDVKVKNKGMRKAYKKV